MKHAIFLHLFRASLISIVMFYSFQCSYLTHVLVTILKYFIFLCYCKWTFEISLFNCLLLIYRNAIDSYMSILYSVTLLNVLISSRNLLMDSLDFQCVLSYHLQIETVLLLFNLYVYYFFLSYCTD